MWIGNLMLVVLNLPLIGMWVQAADQVPYRLLYPAILLFCCIGAYSINNNVFDVFVTAAVRRSWATCSTSSTASRRRCCWASCSAR